MNFKNLFKQRDENTIELQREARYYARILTSKLTQLGICHHFAKSKKDMFESGVSKVSFSVCVASPEALFYQINAMKLPYGVKLADIDDEAILDDLGVAVGHPVRMSRDVNGAWLILERDSGVFAIPANLSFSDVLGAWPKDSKKSLIVPLGVGKNKIIQYRSLAEMPHALVGGATGAGKTTFLHAWICSLFLHNSPDDLRMMLVDLKGGTEFTDYKSLPHVLVAEADGVHGFVKSADDVVATLQYLQREMDSRLSKFEENNIRNLAEWNYKHRGTRLPRIVCVIDELAVIMYDGGLRKFAVPLLADLTARGRAPGIHCVLATQRPEVRVVDGQIKGNTDARFAFRMTDNASSMIILDTAEAAKFDDRTPLGRFIYRRGVDRNELQAPLVTPGQIREFVQDIGKSEDIVVTAITPEQILKDAVTRFNGMLGIIPLVKFYEGKVSERYLRKFIAGLDDSVIEIDGVAYTVVQEKERQPRRLVPVNAMTSLDVGRGSESESIEGGGENG